jgi:hypothetical protein
MSTVPVCTVHRAQLTPEDGGLMRCPKGGPTGHLLSKRDGWSQVPAGRVGAAVPPPSTPVIPKSTARERTLRGQAKHAPAHAARRLSAGDPPKPPRFLTAAQAREMEAFEAELAESAPVGDVTAPVPPPAETPATTRVAEPDEPGDVTPALPPGQKPPRARTAICRRCAVPFEAKSKTGRMPRYCDDHVPRKVRNSRRWTADSKALRDSLPPPAVVLHTRSIPPSRVNAARLAQAVGALVEVIGTADQVEQAFRHLEQALVALVPAGRQETKEVRA